MESAPPEQAIAQFCPIEHFKWLIAIGSEWEIELLLNKFCEFSSRLMSTEEN